MRGHEGSGSCWSWRIVRQLWHPCQGSGTLMEGGGGGESCEWFSLETSNCPPGAFCAVPLDTSAPPPPLLIIPSQKGVDGVTAWCNCMLFHLCPSPQITTKRVIIGYKRGLFPRLARNSFIPFILFYVCHMAGYFSSVSCVRFPLCPVKESSHTRLISQSSPPLLPPQLLVHQIFIDR